MMAEGFDKLIYVNYIIAATTQALVYAIGGEALVDTSTGIQFAAYESEWYKCDQKIKKNILMVMRRAGKVSGVNVPFFKASMETFASVSINMKKKKKMLIYFDLMMKFLQIMYTASSYMTLLNKFI